MERRYLTVFIAILVASLILGIVWNAVLDISNRGEIKEAIKATFESVKSNNAEEFVKQTKLDYSAIYQDSRRESGLVDIYALFSGATQPKSVSLVRILERTACLAAVTFTDAEGKDVTHHMLLFKYKDRTGDTKWVPYGVLTTKDRREKMLKQLREMVSPRKELVTRLNELAEKVKSPELAEAIRELSTLAPSTDKKEKQEEFTKKVNEIIETITSSEIVKGLEEVLQLAAQGSEEIKDKLGALAKKAESPEVAEKIQKLATLAGEEEKKDELVKGVEKLLNELKLPEVTKELQGALRLATADREKSALKQVQEVFGRPAKEVEGQIAGILSKLAPAEQTRERLVGTLKQVKGLIEVPELVEGINVEETIEKALPKVKVLAEKFQSIADNVESQDAANRINRLAVLASSTERVEKEQFYEKLAGLIDKVKTPELAKEMKEAVKLAKKELSEKLKELSGKTEPAEVAEVVKELSELAVSTEEEKEEEFLKKLKELPGSVKALKVAKELENAWKKSVKLTLRLSRKLYFLAKKVNTLWVAEAVMELSALAASGDQAKTQEFAEKVDVLIGKLNSPEFVKQFEETLKLATEGNKDLVKKLEALAEKTESAELAGKVNSLLELFFGGSPTLLDELEAVAMMLKTPEDAARLAKTELGKKAWEAKKLAEEDSLDPLSVFEPVNKPKGACARLIKRLTAIGEAEEPEKEKAKVLGVARNISNGLRSAAAMWSQFKSPYVWRYRQAVRALAELAPTEELKKEAERLLKAAKDTPVWEAGDDDLPDLNDFAQEVKNALLEKERIRAKQFKALGELAVDTLKNEDAPGMFAKGCELAAEALDMDSGKLAGGYAELASLPTEQKLSVTARMPALISNDDTLAAWTDLLELDKKEIEQGFLIALGHVLEAKSMEDLVRLSLETEIENVMLFCEGVLEKALGKLDVSLDEYFDKPAQERKKLAETLAEKINEAKELKKVELGLGEVVEGLSADALDGGDLHESRAYSLQRASRIERGRRGRVEAIMRSKIEHLIGSFPARWAYMDSKDDYTKWAFPDAPPKQESLERGSSVVGLVVILLIVVGFAILGIYLLTRGLKFPGAAMLLICAILVLVLIVVPYLLSGAEQTLSEKQEKFASIVVGKKVVAAITHHWYPDPEDGFQQYDSHLTSEIVRVRFQLNPGAGQGEEEYTVNDFMLLLKMAPDWSVKWKLYRVCNLYEYDKCWEIVEQEFEKRKAYFADGKVR